MKAAVYCATRNLYADMIPAVKSLLHNSDVDKVYFLIEDDKFPYPIPDVIETINVADQKIFRKNGPNYNSYWTWMCLMRCALAKVLPQDLDRVLSLDMDTVVMLDISSLWNIPMEDEYFAQCMERWKSRPDFIYHNAGVTMHNLKKLREDGMDDKIIHELNTKKLDFPDQDVINNLCQGHVKLLPADYNVCDCTDIYRLIKIIHFAGIKPWNHFPEVVKFRNMDWSEVRDGLCAI